MQRTLAAAVLAVTGTLAVDQQALDDLEQHFLAHARQVTERDAFAVFDHPPMLSASEAEEQGMVRDGDRVIGIRAAGEAKAYPVPVMGTAELGNDTIGGIPVAVSW